MALKEALGTGFAPVAGVSAIAVAAVVGYTVYIKTADPVETEVAPAPAALVVPKTDAPTSVEGATPSAIGSSQEPEEVISELEVFTARAPSFDVVRIAVDGVSTVAGQADPTSTVFVLLDGERIAQTTTSTGGEFVALFDLEASDHVRELQLISTVNGVSTPSESSIVVTPTVTQAVTPDPEVSAQDSSDQDAPDQSDIVQEAPSTEDAPADDLTEQVAQAEPPKETAVEHLETAAASAEELTEMDQDVVVPAPPDPLTAASEPVVSEPVLAEAMPDDAMPDAPAAVETAAKSVAAEGAAQPTVLKADAQGVQVLQSAGPQNSIVIDAISYGPDGSVFASGRAQAGSTVRLYVDNVLKAETVAAVDGQWRSEMDVDTGLYTLRADMLKPDATVASRVAIPFKREDVQVLADIAGVPSDLTVDPVSTKVASEGAAEEEKEGADADVAAPVATDLDVSEDTPRAATSRIASVTVQPGNTLWGIASDAYGDGFLFARVFDANEDAIRDPDLIYPGQVFVLPE